MKKLRVGLWLGNRVLSSTSINRPRQLPVISVSLSGGVVEEYHEKRLAQRSSAELQSPSRTLLCDL